VVAVLLGQDTDPGDIAKIAIGAGLPYAVFTGNSTQELTLKGAFSFTGGTGAGIGAMAAYAKKMGYRNVAAITINSPAAIAVTQALGGIAFKKAGVGLKVIPVSVGTADMTPQVQAALSGGANALVVVGATTFCTAFFNAVAAVAPQTPRMGVPPCATQNVLSTSPAAAVNGLVVPLPFRLDDTSDPSVATYDRVTKQYSTNTTLAGDPEGGYGYATVLAFVNIMKADLSGSDVTPTALLAALSKANGIPLPLAPGLTLTCNGTVLPSLPNICSAGVYMYKLSSNRKSQFVYQTNAAPLFASS
jgi:branched-chain amino acid transport system substrate-binding protein